MASTLLGIDLGSYSVKVARLEAGFRSVSLVGLYEIRLPDAALEGTPTEPTPPSVQLDDTSAEQPSLTSQATEAKAALLTSSADEQSASTGKNQSATTLVDASPRDTLLRRQMRALETLLADIKPKGESSAVGFCDEVTLRLLDVPLSDPKKAQLALPFELSGQLMSDLDDQVVDQTLISSHNSTGVGDEPSSLWIAACLPKHEVRQHLRALHARQIDPRICGSIALAPAALFVSAGNRRRDKSASAPPSPPENPLDGELAPTPPSLPAWVIDMGHRYTHICAVAPHPSRPGQMVVPFVRSIARGGLQLTQAVARAHDVHMTRAEMLKHEYGLDETADRKTAAAVREALRPLLRELRQTLSAYVARHGERPRAMYLCGGGSELSGLYELLQEEFDIDVLPLMPPHQAPWFGNREAHRSLVLSSSQSIDSAAMHRSRMPAFALLRRFAACAPAVGLALSLFQPVPQVNFRKGDLAFRTDYAFLREKAPYLVAFAVALFICVSGWVMASLHVAKRESERLRLRMISETTALFGEAYTDGNRVFAELQAILREDKSSDKRIPQASALDLLEDISRAAPLSSGKEGGTDSSGGGLEVRNLDIRPKKITLEATAASAKYAEDFAAALRKISCVKDVQNPKVLTVTNTGPDGKPIDVKQFSLELTTTCP